MKDFFSKVGDLLRHPAQEISHHIKGTDAQIDGLKEELRQTNLRLGKAEEKIAELTRRLNVLDEDHQVRMSCIEDLHG